MEHASTMSGMSFRQTLRPGQAKAITAFQDTNSLNIQLPTGYGKTYTACCCYAVKQQVGANRLFFIFPTDAQLEQFKKDGHVDMHYACVSGVLQVVDCRFYGTEAIKKSLKNKAQVFVTTVQSLITARGMDLSKALMQKGRWMVVVDEYHHYGIDKAWGKSVLALDYDYFLAMSATPTRKEDDSAFGSPDVYVPYRHAVREKAVKPLKGHSYIYRVDFIETDGQVHSYTTDELVEELGSSDPATIDKIIISRKMRWSPKYSSPLISIPIERMLKNRLETGYKLQALIGALCVSHAEIICSQVRSLFPHLEIDWVGTGDNGRKKEDNKDALRKFCPPKDPDTGRRGRPDLDVLVHVGMAGEGLDSVLVSEIIHLNKASVNNTNDQENGRASRYTLGVTGHINFDSSSGYAQDGYIGEAIMDAMDGNDTDPTLEDDKKQSREIDEELPDEPVIVIFDMTLEGVNSGDIGVQRMKSVLEECGMQLDYVGLNEDLNHADWDKVIRMYQQMHKKQAMEHEEETTIAQWKEAVNNAMSHVVGMVIRRMAPGSRVDKSLAGDIKKRINTQKKRSVGGISNDLDICKQHYQWTVTLQKEISKKRSLPTWLT